MFLPSKLAKPLSGIVAGSRFEEPLSKALTIADDMAVGTSDAAIDRRSSLVAFIIRVLSALIAFGSQVFLARWMGVYEYGVFVWVWVAVVLMGSVICLGFPSTVVKFLPQYRQSGDLDAARGVPFTNKVFSLSVATIVAASGIAALFILKD